MGNAAFSSVRFLVVSGQLEGLGVLIAVPEGSIDLRIGGIPVSLRLARQFRKAGYGGPIVLAYSGSPPSSGEFRSARLETLAPPCPEWVCVPGDLVLEGVNGEFGPTSDWEGSLAWAEKVCRGESAPVDASILGRAVDEASAAELDERLLDRIGRPQDPNFTKLWRRKLSRSISRRLSREGTHPNTVTLIGTLFGFAAAMMFGLGTYGWTLAGSVIFVLSRLLDDCDGEVARLTVRQSRAGAILDVSADIVVHGAAFVGLAVGAQGLWTPLIGVLLGGGIATYLVLRHVTGTPFAEDSKWARFFETSASGDFAYILLLFALIGKPVWFLWASAIGAQAFWIALLVLILHRRRALLEGSLYLVGAALLGSLIYQIGPEKLFQDISLVGWGFALVFAQEILTISTATLGWVYALQPDARSVSFWRLGSYRVIAEAINHLTPTATLGGEIVRARLIAPSIGGREAAASVTLAKTAETAGQVTFLTLGLGLVLPFVEKLGGYRWAMLALVAGAAVGIVLLVRLLDRGLFARASKRLKWFARYEQDLAAVDARIKDCVRRRPADLARSIGWHTASYAVRLVEVWIILAFLGIRPSWELVLGIEVLSVLIDGIFFFVPAKLGTQEGGKMLIFLALGLPVEKGLALGLVRRGRELVWDAAGFALYALIPVKTENQRAPASATGRSER